jgi:hypothetical protein
MTWVFLGFIYSRVQWKRSAHRGLFQVREIPSHFLESFAVLFGVAEIQEMLVTAMPGLEAHRMLDLTPVLLGSPGDFLNISKHSIDISAIDTVKPFVTIQVPRVDRVGGGCTEADFSAGLGRLKIF